MPPVAFHANCVAVEDMEGFWLVGFADREFDTHEYLMLQRSFEDDEQDTRLGMNTYHVEWNDQGWSCYGGIARFELHRDRVIVHMTEDGAVRLGRVPVIEVTFSISAQEFVRLRARLRKVFAGTTCLVELTAEDGAAPGCGGR